MHLPLLRKAISSAQLDDGGRGVTLVTLYEWISYFFVRRCKKSPSLAQHFRGHLYYANECPFTERELAAKKGRTLVSPYRFYAQFGRPLPSIVNRRGGLMSICIVQFLDLVAAPCLAVRAPL